MAPLRSACSAAITLLCGLLLTAVIRATPELDESAAVVKKQCWIFTHLQKCGGTTIKNIMEESWGSRFMIYDSARWKLGDGFMQAFGDKLAEGNEWDALSGGYPEALRHSPAVRKKCAWFTLFRHPTSRMVSAFYYCKALPDDVACASEILNANDADLLTFAKHWGNFALRQFALNLVSSDEVMAFSKTDTAKAKLPGIKNVADVPGWYLLKIYQEEQAALSGFLDEPDHVMYEMLQPVQDLLRDDYAAVGILEEFNTTLSLFDAALDIPEVNWRKQFHNQGKGNVDWTFEKEKREAMQEAWTNSEIKKYMKLDLLLYEHAVHVFQQQASSYGLR